MDCRYVTLDLTSRRMKGSERELNNMQSTLNPVTSLKLRAQSMLQSTSLTIRVAIDESNDLMVLGYSTLSLSLAKHYMYVDERRIVRAMKCHARSRGFGLARVLRHHSDATSSQTFLSGIV